MLSSEMNREAFVFAEKKFFLAQEGRRIISANRFERRLPLRRRRQRSDLSGCIEREKPTFF